MKAASRMTSTLALLAGIGLMAGCSSDSSLETSPTFSAARFLPADPSAPPSSAPVPSTERGVYHGISGAEAVTRANRASTVEPDDSTMRGATWIIDDVDPSLIYRVRTAPGRVTTLLLPPGERFNGAVAGNVDSYLINVAYAGPRPAVSILPRTPDAHGNLQLVTTGGFYSFDLATGRQVAINLVDIAHRDSAPAGAAAAVSMPQPEGDFTRLALVREDGPLPAWAPAEVWADSRKMVVRFHGPLPVLPALFAGGKGEQVVSYSSRTVGGEIYLVTSRRVTEAELRLGGEKVRVSVDPDAVAAGSAADPAQGADGWKPATALAPAQTPATLPTDPVATVPPRPRQPMATAIIDTRV